MHRYHPEDPRSGTKGYEGSLTQDEEGALNELQSIIEEDGLDLRLVRGDYGEGFDGGQHAVEPLRLCLLRFLRGNAFSVSKALSQLEDCVDHRRQHPTDKLLSKSPREVLECDVEEFNSFYPRWLMGYDRLGRPMLATRYGSLRLWEMTKLTTIERMTELHAREQELLLRQERRAETYESGRTCSRRAMHVHGTAQSSAQRTSASPVPRPKVTKAFVRLFKMRAHMDQLLFPEVLGKCFIVNTPGLFSYVWAMFCPMLDERTRSKIAIISRPQDWQKALQEIADPEQLSPEYGGKTRRPQGGRRGDEQRRRSWRVGRGRGAAGRCRGIGGGFGGGSKSRCWNTLVEACVREKKHRFYFGFWKSASVAGGRNAPCHQSTAFEDLNFFDALAELDQSNTYRGGGTRRRNRSSRLRSRSGSDIEAGRPLASTNLSRRTSGLAGFGAGPAVAGVREGRPSSETGGEGGEAQEEGTKKHLLAALLGWCYAPVLRRLERKCVDQVIRLSSLGDGVVLDTARAVPPSLSVSLSRAKVLGLQWCAVTAVCLGSLLLLLALIGSAGARLRNRFTLLGFAALEAAVALGMLLSGAWCLALAGGSATLSDLTWEAMHHEIRNMDEEHARWDDERRFRQLRRCFQEANALCTIFACVCAGYGGYALSFTVSLGLGANAASTYLLVASSYLLLLAGAVGFWAARSGRPDAFRIHSAALVPAGAAYASLSVVQLVAVGPSDGLVTEAWGDLRADGENLYSIQASVSTMLIVGGVLSAVTFALVVCNAVASRAARLALLHLPETSTHRRRNLRKSGKLTRGEKLVTAWALALATTSTLIDGSFAVFSAWLARDGGTGGTWLVSAWRAMGRGDRRYVEGDTFTVATAIIVALVQGPTAVLYAWAVYTRRGFRFSVGILVCTASLHTQLLRYVTSAESSSSESESESESGSKSLYVAVSVLLALLQVVGALAVLIFNVRKLTKRVNAAELLLHARLGGKVESSGRGERDAGYDCSGSITGDGTEDLSGSASGGRGNGDGGLGRRR
ncbi:unnamed protein product [Scytosiphon promiscuus]